MAYKDLNKSYYQHLTKSSKIMVILYVGKSQEGHVAQAKK